MGYDVHKFVEVVDANLLCGICGLVFEDPVLTPCGHSFCLLCLETWLETSLDQNRQHHRRSSTSAGSCPECREAVLPNEAKSELSLRNLINGFYLYCEYRDQGCHATVKLERAKDHASRCPHSPVICAGCDETVQMIHLPNHQIHCRGIAETISSDDNEDYKNERGSRCVMFAASNHDRRKPRKSMDLSDLLEQMEKEMSILKRDLLLADVNNAIIESEYVLRKSELKKKEEVLLARTINKKSVSVTEPHQTSFQNQCSVSRAERDPPTNASKNTENNQMASRNIPSIQTSFQNQFSVSRANNPATSSNRAGLNWFEYPGDHGRSLPHSIPSIPASRLASFIFQFLLNKPDYVDGGMVFVAIQRCYDHFVSSSVLYDQSVHVLITIAIASDWFTTMQRQNFSQWLVSLAKCRELLDSSSLR